MHGWLLLDKPENISSAHALAPLRRLFRKTKIGHSGTLDPFASGLLLIALGEATKLMPYATNDEKEYLFSIQWGENRDTLDREGATTATNSKRPSLQEIEGAITQFLGQINQIPPAYSAIKLNGKRAYKLARSGIDIELASRLVTCHNLAIQQHNENNTIFKLTCGKGFYVRSLARDLAAYLGCCGYVDSLRRTRLGKFYIEDAIPLDYLQNLVHNSDTVARNDFSFALQMDTVLDDILVHEVSAEDGKLLSQGRQIAFQGPKSLTTCEGQVVAVKVAKQLIAMCNFAHGVLHPIRVFNNN